ncbi:MAG: GNAT family N-acetyltransferase [Chitinophagales bacterium]|nr:GNAT family N-acetyltransferase [Chitinophagales bacterium]
MLKTEIYNAVNRPTMMEKKKVVNFLFEHLDEYGDPKEDIKKAIEYATKERSSFGGFTMLLKENNTIKGAVVINQTGMDGYIPENILVYIAIHKDARGKGLGKILLKECFKHTKGDIALHVEPDNPAKFLYEKLGFTNKYLEMRLKIK